MTESDRPNLISLRVKLLNGKPLTQAEMAAVYQLLLAAEGIAGDTESVEALNWRAVRNARDRNFDTSIPQS